MTQHEPLTTTLRHGDDSLAFIGNATMLLRLGGLTLLTDPSFVPRGTDVPIGYGMTTRRLTDPAMTIDELPDLDAVVLSHWHGDHFDQVAQERLDRDVPILTTPQAAGELTDLGFARPLPLDTWATHLLVGREGSVRVTSLPARHAPGPLEIALPDVMGSLLEVFDGTPGDAAVAPRLRLYITGDTIVYEGLREIGTRAGAIDLAILHLGGTRVMGMTVTMDAEQGVELLGLLTPTRAAAIHYDDYDAFKSPIEDFVLAAREAGLADSVQVLRRGEVVEL